MKNILSVVLAYPLRIATSPSSASITRDAMGDGHAVSEPTLYAAISTKV
jgi:hypothetical protein